MNKRTLCLAAALAGMTASQPSAPAHACKMFSERASLCDIVPASADVRDAPDGRIAYTASGRIRTAGRSKDGLWVRVAMPCSAYRGWIASKDIACPAAPASAHEAAR
jgi:hypothetical protein